jgi:hypothetical protein
MIGQRKRLLAEKAWNRGVAALLAFREREGHCDVPRHHKENGYRLGQWVAVQRYTQNDLVSRRKAQLEEIGFVWSARDQWWEEAFAALKAFKAREGHCYVPAAHVEGALHLGYWVTVQRRNRHKMARERRQRLDKIGFAWNGRVVTRNWTRCSRRGIRDTPAQKSVGYR